MIRLGDRRLGRGCLQCGGIQCVGDDRLRANSFNDAESGDRV
jgi:hypothetical protein